MIRGFYTSLSGMISAMTRQNVVADAIANVNTAGYKAERDQQAEFGMQLASTLTGASIGHLGTAVYPTDLTLDRSAGPIQQTDVPTDLALEGDGLFAVRTPSGTAYTRAGDFHVDSNGTLLTPQGYPVLDTTGAPIVVSGTLTVGPDGTVDGGPQRLAIATFPATGLVRLGDSLYGTSAPLPAATGVTVRQGALEASNVDMDAAMTDLLSLQREFSLGSEAFSMQSDTLTTLSDLGRLK